MELFELLVAERTTSLKRRLSLGDFAKFHVGLTQQNIGRRICRIESHGFSQMYDSLLELNLAHPGPSQFIVSAPQRRLHHRRLLKYRHNVVHFPGLNQDVGQLTDNSITVRINLNLFLKLLLGVMKVLLFQIKVTQRGMRAPKPGIELKRLPELDDRKIIFAFYLISLP